jgi:hypothetical protein
MFYRTEIWWDRTQDTEARDDGRGANLVSTAVSSKTKATTDFTVGLLGLDIPKLGKRVASGQQRIPAANHEQIIQEGGES